jgi:PleD family two-component response regulator
VLVEGADKALFEAKKHSRNVCKICSAEDMMDLCNLKN